MIVGNGLLGRAFMEKEFDLSNVIIFASGVSKSNESDEYEFNREIETLLKYKYSPSKLIYFSTTSVLDPELTHTHYVKHKLIMEETVKVFFEDYIIFRLPNVVGYSGNDNTIFRKFTNLINREEEILLFENAERYLIGIDDVVELVFELIQSRNMTIELFLPFKYTPIEIATEISLALGKALKYKKVAKGGSYDLKLSNALKKILDVNYNEINKIEYLKKLVSKYAM